ncbi:MAG: hypothetical protein EZS28_044019 [Streblomastix strix]|uniref:Reverse transcriptase/retrotransposon-derived protein RNase H-like domain-containing protein n=1 Tax=Streblomastix strix TaxID=222440 RepID=A0A5J4TRB8_9EUKA|nr:MAG: hypothetical protein EZS28_044019 [Streblomastix strix]
MYSLNSRKLNFLRISIPRASFDLIKMNKIITRTVNKEAWNTQIVRTSSIIQKLELWKVKIRLINPTSINPFKYEAILTSDASGDG